MKQLLNGAGYLAYLWAAGQFCKKHLAASKKKDWLFVMLSMSVYLVLNRIATLYPDGYILVVTVNHLLFTGLVLLFFQERWEKKILAAAMLMTVMAVGVNFFEAFLSCFALFFKYTVKMVSEPFLCEWEGGGVRGVSQCLAAGSVYWLSKHVQTLFCGRRGKWYALLAVPLFIILTVMDVAAWGAGCGIMVRSGGSMGLYYDQMFSHAGFLLLSLLLSFAAGVYVFGMNRIYLEQEKSGRYRLQNTVYQMITEQYQQSERLRHDMKNHIVALSALFQNKEWEKMGDYLKKMADSGMDAGGDLTGNKAVDALLYQKRKRAEETDIDWECDVQMPKGCISEFDLCVLFGNLLDNALEACQRMQCREYRFIHIQAKTVKKCFLLEVKNSMNQAETYTDGFTIKENPWEHGIGMMNIGDVVHGYDGVIQLQAENGIFAISILMPLPDAAYDSKTAV